jgi:hypothetical protein
MKRKRKIRKKGDLWLAVGDETGDWDNDSQSEDNFLGVALVIATVKDWQKALNEKIDNQKISERMKKHHVMEVMVKLPTGDCSLDKPNKNKPVQIKTFKNLRWLAEHNSLITIGAYAKRELIWNQIHLGRSHAQALGQAYGLLLSLIIPFLNNNDELFFIPSLFSSDPKSLPNKQAEIIEEQNTQNSVGTQLKQEKSQRPHGHIETTIVSALHETRKNVENWQGLSINLDGGTFSYFQNKHPNAPDQILKQKAKNNPMYNIADMGAALMTLSKNTEKPTHLVDPNKTWKNVNFFKFEELLP